MILVFNIVSHYFVVIIYYQHHYCYFDHRYCVYEMNCFIIITDTGFELCHDGIKIEMGVSKNSGTPKWMVQNWSAG